MLLLKAVRSLFRYNREQVAAQSKNRIGHLETLHEVRRSILTPTATTLHSTSSLLSPKIKCRSPGENILGSNWRETMKGLVEEREISKAKKHICTTAQ